MFRAGPIFVGVEQEKVSKPMGQLAVFLHLIFVLKCAKGHEMKTFKKLYNPKTHTRRSLATVTEPTIFPTTAESSAEVLMYFENSLQNNGTGTDISDIVATGMTYSGTIVEQGAYSADFNGHDNYLEFDIGDTDQDTYTFAFWCYFRGYGPRLERAYIVDNRVSADDGFAWFVDTLATGDTDNTALEFMGIHAGDGMINCTFAPAVESWEHWALVAHPSEGYFLYRNGVLESGCSAETDDDPFAAEIMGISGGVVVGSRWDLDTDTDKHFFNAVIDEFFFAPRFLSEDAVARLAGVTPTSSPTCQPSLQPSYSPTLVPSIQPSPEPSLPPSALPSVAPTGVPSYEPSLNPSFAPSGVPSLSPTDLPSFVPTPGPTRRSFTRKTIAEIQNYTRVHENAPTLSPTTEGATPRPTVYTGSDGTSCYPSKLIDEHVNTSGYVTAVMPDKSGFFVSYHEGRATQLARSCVARRSTIIAS